MEATSTSGIKKLCSFVLTLLLLFCSLSVSAKEISILIVKSSDNSFFNRTIQQLINQSPAQVKFNIISLETLKADASVLDQQNIIVTLGLNAANYSYEKITNTPVIHSYLTEFQFNRHPVLSYHYSVLLDQPLNRILRFIKILIGAKKIGILKNSVDTISADNILKLETSLALNLQQKIYEDGDNPVTIVRNLLKTSDVLLSVPDPQIYNRQTLKGILLTSYRQNKPVISYSPSHVNSGALAAIFSSPKNIGNQIAELLNKLITDSKFKPETHYFAADFDIEINNRVAKSLGLKVAEKQAILDELILEQNK